MKKKLSSALVIFFIINLFQFGLSEKAYADTPIIGQATANVEQMEKWAKEKGASDTFVGLAPIYVSESSKHGDINPVIAYAQSAIETGYGKFGGIIDESYHNPCGLKTTEGGGDKDPDAHMRFKNWNDGVTAHLDHLALYAGAKGYPRDNTTDPRHFKYLFGTAGNSIVGLSGKWAPSDSTYSDKILRLANEIEKTQVVEEEPKLVLDYPKGNSKYNNKLNVSGWALDDSNIKYVKIYVDNKFIKNAEYGTPRQDVYNAYPLYNNKKSGFSTEIDLSGFKPGKYTIKVELVANDGDKKSIARNVDIIREKPLMTLDFPKEGEIFKSDLDISGWALNESGIKSVKAYINNTFKADLKYGYNRPDVDEAYPEFNNKTAGYRGTINVSNLSSGNYTLKIEAIGNDGVVSVFTRQIKISRNKALTCIDKPKANASIDGKLLVSGWALNDSGISEVKTYVDGKFVKTLNIGQQRLDVFNSYPQYGMKNSGYSGELNIYDYSKGNHSLKVEAIGKDGTKSEANSTFIINKKESIVTIDSPKSEEKIEGNISISGWAIGESKIKKVEAFINNTSIGELKYGNSRIDVQTAYPAYRDIENCGFKSNIDISKIKPGRYVLRVEATGTDGTVGVMEKMINIYKKGAVIQIDKPSGKSDTSNELIVSGWALDPDGINDVNVYIDNQLLGKADYGSKRQDVANAYNGYPDALHSGYSSSFDVRKFKPGTHRVKVEIISKIGTKSFVERNISISRNEPIACIDKPSNDFTTTNTLAISGWGLNDSGIKNIKAFIDNRFVGEFNNTIKRNDVATCYPNYANDYNHGFSGSVDLNKVAPGKKSLMIEIEGNDGTKAVSMKSIYIQKKPQFMNIETPRDNSTEDGEFTIRGWAVNDSGIAKVNLYVDGKYKKELTKGIRRDDVDAVYPTYRDSLYSGYQGTIDFTDIAGGKHAIKVEAIGNDGTVNSNVVYVSRNRGKTIALDPGHTIDGGPDGGSKSTHSGIEYDEGKLDMQLSMKLKSDLEQKGFNVIMTQTPFDLIHASSVNDSLKYRVHVAELYDADLFISIHHNNYDNSSAYGSEVWYSDPKDSSIKPLYGAGSESKKIASTLASTLASSGSYYNRGSKNGRLYVTRMSTMPAVLLEAGFISNPSDAKKAASSSNQSKISNGLASKINDILN